MRRWFYSKMERVLFGLLLFVTYVSAYVEVGKFYHDEVGIPLAKRLLEAENNVLNNTPDVDVNRIVGGVVAPAQSHPYLAGLVISFASTASNAVCGSSLVSATRLVTAAHCWFDGNRQAVQFVVVLGTQFVFHGGTRIPTNRVFMHPMWNPSLLNNDIAMIYLPFSVSFSARIQPIALPSIFDLGNNFVGLPVVAAGYGVTSDAQLGISVNQVMSHVNLQVITVQQCMAVFGSNFVRDTNICTSGAGGVGICRGDSGGPLVLHRYGRPTLVGVSSFVAQNRCQDGFPSAFARTTSFYGFIIQHM